MPVNDQLLKRLRPFDIVAFKTAQANDGTMTLNEAITAMQGETLTHSCPQCLVADNNTGVITVTPPGLTIVCPTCAGMLKTAIPYLLYSGKYIGLAITGVTFITPPATMQLAGTVPGGAWTSGTPATATIDDGTGLLTAVAAGTTVITYTVSGVSATIIVTVTGAPA